MTVSDKDRLSLRSPDAPIDAALRLIDSLVRKRTLDEIQQLVTDGKLEDLFPGLVTEEPTPTLGSFDDMVEAPAQRLTDQQFEKLLERS